MTLTTISSTVLYCDNVKLLRKFFYINVCGLIGRGKFLYETRVLDNSYL